MYLFTNIHILVCITVTYQVLLYRLGIKEIRICSVGIIFQWGQLKNKQVKHMGCYMVINTRGKNNKKRRERESVRGRAEIA